MIKEVSTGYVPRPLQLQLHRMAERFKVVVCHRRFGKTHYALNEMIDQSFRNNKKNPQYAYIAPTYGQAKRVAWDLLKDYLKHIPGVIINEADLRVDIPRPSHGDRIRFLLLGAENPDSLRGIYLDGVVLDEYAEMSPTIWSQVVRPALMDREGWAIFIGTPKGQNQFYELLQYAKNGKPEEGIPKDINWGWAVFKASETGIIPQDELEAAKALMSPEEYEQEMECSFTAALVGAYYGKEMEKAETAGRITHVDYDPALPVSTYWDLGIDDSMAVWFTQNLAGRELRIIDYEEHTGMGLPAWSNLLQKKGYVYDTHVLPHDGAVRELGTGVSRVETLQKLQRGIRVRVAKKMDLADGINAVRLMLAKCWFDRIKCDKGIKALKNYERAWDAKNKVFQNRPKHNWASHGSDAFRTMATSLQESQYERDVRHGNRNSRQSLSDFDYV